MGDEWISTVAALFRMLWAVVALFLIYRVLKMTRHEPGFSLWPRDVWGAAGRLSLIVLAVGVGLSPVLLALYPVRYWCVATAALLAVIFRLGSRVERRSAGAMGIFVLGGLTVYSVVAPYPHFGPIVKSYAAFCLALAIIAVVRRLRRHHNPVASTG